MNFVKIVLILTKWVVVITLHQRHKQIQIEMVTRNTKEHDSTTTIS